MTPLLRPPSREAQFENLETKQKERNKTMKTLSKIPLAAAALTLLGIAAATPHGHEAQDHGGKHSEARWKTIVIDVAEDARTSSLNSASPTDTEPKRGATAIINGKI